ncbi:hypothetical protein [Dyadobacter sp. 676]|uniref:HEAT repeat domain-containing protein n=1 Tax=Dyadobacter sp. 676 TaxID=3088362 RepID=A0AAU8FPB0_9BACT
MKTCPILLLSLLLWQVTVPCSAQNNFEDKLARAALTWFDTAQVNAILKNNRELLLPFSQVMQFSMSLQGRKMAAFPLAALREKPVYESSVPPLLASPVPNNRLLGYLLIAATGDVSRRDLLAQRLKTEKASECTIWLGMGLMHLGYDHTSAIFPWVVENNSLAGNYLFPLFCALPKDSLRQTAYRFAASANWKERIYAIQSLGYTGYSAQSDSILKKAIRDWPLHLKGYALVPAKSIGCGELLREVKPFLDSAVVRQTALEALAASPTPEDRDFVAGLAISNPADREAMDALKASENAGMIRLWLKLLGSSAVPDTYFFTIAPNSLLRTDSFLPDLLAGLKDMKNPDFISRLIPALAGRRDIASQDYLNECLRNENQAIRNAAQKALALSGAM